MILLKALMYREPSGCVTFSLMRGGTPPPVKYLNAGLADRMASKNTLGTKTNMPKVKCRSDTPSCQIAVINSNILSLLQSS